MSDPMEMLLAQWAEHRAQGRARGYDKAVEWVTPPDYAIQAANEWVRQDNAWRHIIGTRLAVEAIETYEKETQND